MQLYDAIFYRKSIKKFSNKKLSIDMFEEVRRLCTDLHSLNKDIKVNAHPILKGDSLKFIIKKRHRIVAPHYIVLTVEFPKDEEQENIQYFDSVGFAGEELILRLTEIGLATSWLDNNFNKESISDFVHLKEDEQPAMLIAIGFPEGKEELFRKKTDDIDRKTIKNISKNLDKKWINIIECVRLSPSYKNTQPWRFYQNNESIDIYMKKDSNEELNLVNMGIALKHFEIACKYNDIDFEFIKKEAKSKLRKEYYVSVVQLKSNSILK